MTISTRNSSRSDGIISQGKWIPNSFDSLESLRQKWNSLLSAITFVQMSPSFPTNLQSGMRQGKIIRSSFRKETLKKPPSPQIRFWSCQMSNYHRHINLSVQKLLLSVLLSSEITFESSQCVSTTQQNLPHRTDCVVLIKDEENLASSAVSWLFTKNHR